MRLAVEIGRVDPDNLARPADWVLDAERRSRDGVQLVGLVERLGDADLVARGQEEPGPARDRHHADRRAQRV